MIKYMLTGHLCFAYLFKRSFPLFRFFPFLMSMESPDRDPWKEAQLPKTFGYKGRKVAIWRPLNDFDVKTGRSKGEQ